MAKRRKKSRYKGKKHIFTIIICVFLLIFVAASAAVAAIIKNSPNLDVNQVLNLNEPSVLYDDKGNFMDVVVSTEQRTVVPFKSIPDNLKNAFVSIEDERFYKHKGIDIKRIFGVILIDIKNKISNKPGIQGASTITQQLVRDIYLSKDVSIKRKIQEMYMSLKLERLITKDQILEAYMNTIFLGGRSFGVESASQQYFKKPVGSLSLIQCAFIAGIPQSPSVYYPYSSAARKNPSIYLNRTKNVLAKMYDNNYITYDQYINAVNDVSNGKLSIQPYSPPKNKLENEWFSMPAIQQVKNDLKLKYKYSNSQVDNLLTYGGLKIYTTMDKQLQKKTQDTLNNSTVFSSSSHTDKNKIVQPQASAVVMDYHTGKVKALVGGRGDQPAMSFNRASSKNYLRPPGSSIKPITVYSPAISSKKYTAASTINDSEWSQDLAQKYASNGNPYYPQNDDGFSNEDMTFRTALAKSSNVIAAKIEDTLGLDIGSSYAEKFGLNLDSTDKSSISSLSLGELHNGTNALEMAAAYGVFGNKGNYTDPILYTKVTDRSGKVILKAKTTKRKVLSESSAYIMYNLLKAPVSSGGTGSNANLGDMPTSGKTGTSSYEKNLWFCGLTPYYSASVWIGNDNNTSLPNSLNSNSSAALWAAIMEPFHTNMSTKDIPVPSGVTSAKICSESGDLPSPLCYIDPTGSKVYTEFFLSGTVPTSICTLPHTWIKGDSIFGQYNNNQYNPVLGGKHQTKSKDSGYKNDKDKNNNNNATETPNPDNNNTKDGETDTPPNQGNGTDSTNN